MNDVLEGTGDDTFEVWSRNLTWRFWRKQLKSLQHCIWPCIAFLNG